MEQPLLSTAALTVDVISAIYDCPTVKKYGTMLTQKDTVSTSDFMRAEAHKIMVRCLRLKERKSGYGEAAILNDFLKIKAEEILTILSEITEVNHCAIYGSLATDTYDELSDIDINIDVSGSDNGQFMIRLVEMLEKKLRIYYYDYAPSLIPDKYIVSLAIDEYNPFLIVDLQCSAEPHCMTVTKQQIIQMNNEFTHMLKLWTANLKHYARGIECYDDIVRMARKLKSADIDAKDEIELLEETLHWLECNASDELITFIASCRDKFNELL